MMAARQGTIVQQLQHISEEEKVKNRARYYSVAHASSPNITYRIQHFNLLVHLVMSCGGELLNKNFMERAVKKATYTSKGAVTELILLADGFKKCFSLVFTTHLCLA